MFDDEIFCNVYCKISGTEFQNITKIFSAFLENETIERFLEVATLPLFRQSWERVLLVEMHFANTDNLLCGSNDAEQFEFFIQEVIKPENFSNLLRKYPDLWERWQAQFCTYCNSLTKFLSRLVADKSLFANHFYGDKIIQKICRITPVGDPHQGMQQTIRIDYINDHNQQRVVYYKPHRLELDVGLCEFFIWWNRNFSIEQLVPATLAREGYGWTSEIKTKPCETDEQVRRYYKRYGSLVALCYLFGSTDLHKDNVIAFGEYPVIIDCETLFSCTLTTDKSLPSDTHLYASWLLPSHSISHSIEISPLSARSNHETDLEIKYNPQKRSSRTKFVARKLVTGHCNCEVLIGENLVQDPLKYREQIIEGMRLTLEFAEQNREIILNKVYECMQDVTVRILFCATSSYTGALRNSWHPDSLFKREAELDLLKLANPARDAEIIQSELLQLKNGDVPYFIIIFDKPVIYDGNGRKLLLQISKTPQQKIEAQFCRLTPAFTEQLIKDLDYALLSYRVRQRKETQQTGSRFVELAHLQDPEWLNALAVCVLDGVLEQALQLDNGYFYWRTIGIAGPTNLQASLTDIHLYDGIAGIALAYHVVGHQLNSETYINFANQLADQIVKQLPENGPAKLGALAGTAGTLWAISFIQASHLTRLLPTIEHELSKLSYQMVTHQWQTYEQLDYVSGAAGSLSMLLRLHCLFINYPIAFEIKQLAVCLANTIKNEGLNVRKDNTLLGFAHGTAGVSAALAEYMTYFRVQDHAMTELINDNVMRETTFRSSCGWPHLGNELITNSSWCHGTAGFGFSRLHLKPYISDAVYEDDMKVIRSRLGECQASIGLCHGMMADYYLERALGQTGNHALGYVRRQIAQNGLTTHFGLNNFEIVGAMTGVTSMFTGDALFSSMKIAGNHASSHIQF